MLRIFIPLLILLTLLGLGSLLIFSSPDAAATAIDPPRVSEERLSQASSADLESAAQEQAAALVLKRTDLDPTQVTVGNSQARLAGGVLIRVVDDATGKAMPNAEVFVLDSYIVDMKNVQQMMASGRSFEHIFRAFGETYIVNQSGEVRIPQPTGRLSLAGSASTYFNIQFQLKVENFAYTLRLKPVESLLVRVVDESGQAVQNAPVILRHKSKHRSTDTSAAKTDANGQAAIKIFDSLKESFPSEEAYVALKILSPSPVEVPVDFDNLPKGFVELIMPETGAVQVNLEGVSGDPSLDGFLVQLSILDSRETNKKIRPLGQWDFGNKNLLDGCSYKKASVSFPFVALGQNLRVRVSSQKGERTAMVDGLGPERLNRDIVFTVTPKSELPLLVGRLLDSSGHVVKGKPVQALVQMTGLLNTKAPHQSILRSDADGHFIVALNNPLHPDKRYSLTLTQSATESHPTQIVRVSFDGHTAQEKLDLGDLTLQEAPVLAQGVVVDYEGNPVEGAYLTIEGAPVDSQHEENVYWSSMRGIYANTQKNGGFELRGLLPDGRYQISASHLNHTSVEVEIPIGSLGLTIQLLRSGNRRGVILLDEGIDPDDLVITVETKDSNGGASTSHVSLKGDGSFVLNNLPAQIGTIRIKAAVYGEDLLVFEDVMLRSPETEIMLEVIDLRGALTFFSLRVIDEQGVEVQNPTIINHTRNRMSFGSHQPLKIITRNTSLDLEITARGYRSVFLSGVNADQDVVLSPGIPIALILNNAPKLPGGWQMEAHLSFMLPGARGTEPEGMVSLPDSLPVTGEEVRIAKAERFQVVISLSCRDEDSLYNGYSWAMFEAPDDIVVTDSNSLQTFRITLNAKALEFLARKTDSSKTPTSTNPR